MLENNIKYSRRTIQNLNESIDEKFTHLKRIDSNFKMSLSGVSRMVMLDRYAQKDTHLETLKEGDLVITIVKPDDMFPIRGIGYIIELLNDEVIIKLEEDYSHNVDENFLVDKTNPRIIKKEKKDIEKPLEIYYEQIAYRVSSNLAKKEATVDLINEWQHKFYEQLKNLKIVPAGRVLYGAGSDSIVTFFNCFVMPMIQDSRKGISKHRQEVMEIMSHGGGVGTNGSTLRPKGTVAKTVGGRSSGSVSWLNDLSSLTHLVQQGGSRRGAQMIMLADWHPDIIEFIISKMQNPKILLWLKENSKDINIINEVNKKLKFINLKEDEKEILEKIIENPNLFTNNQVLNAKEKLNLGGEWKVNNPEFLSGANISIAISHDFMRAVENDDVWELSYPDLKNYTKNQKKDYDEKWHEIGDIREWSDLGYPIKTYYKIKAKALWDLINFCANYSAEPGIFFIDQANDMTNAKSYGMKVVATNPCGEQPLAPYSVCNLAAINLSEFVDKKTKTPKWEALKDTVETCVRMQDNVIDATHYFFKPNEIQAKGERRVGLGIMGLHDFLIWSGLKYGSKEANELINKVFKLISETAYSYSSEIAKEKGSFPFLSEKGSKEKFINTGYMKKMRSDIREKIKEHGIRNSHLLTIAPTGSTGTMVGVSTGLEPYFAFKYYRSGRLGKFIEVNANIVEEWLELNPSYTKENLPEIFVSSMELTPEEHVDVQCIIQRWIDSSISKTVNAPKGYSVKEVEEVYINLYKGGAKGGTVYVDGSRDAQVLSLNKEETKEQTNIEVENKDTISKEQLEKIKENSEFRGNKQDRNIGTNIGDICPICLEGTVLEAAGCATCNNCNAQLKCGL